MIHDINSYVEFNMQKLINNYHRKIEAFIIKNIICNIEWLYIYIITIASNFTQNKL